MFALIYSFFIQSFVQSCDTFITIYNYICTYGCGYILRVTDALSDNTNEGEMFIGSTNWFVKLYWTLLFQYVRYSRVSPDLEFVNLTHFVY